MTVTQAAVVPAVDESFRLETVELDAPRRQEVVVRMVAAGLCHTDLSVRAGRTPFPLPGILGHEGAGVVEAVGPDVTRVRVGDHVLASFTSCGACGACGSGRPASCDTWARDNLLSGQRPDGSYLVHAGDAPVNAGFFGQSSFSRLALVNERCLVTVAPDAPLAVLAPLGCAVQTGVGTVLNVLRPGPGSTLVIFGAGAVGLSAVMGTALLDVERLVVVDRVPSRLRLAEELGATHTIDAGSQDVEAELRELTAGRGADYCVEATGNTTVLEQAISLLAPAGTCAVVGAPRTGATISVDVKFLMRSRQLVGVTEGNSDPSLFVPQLIELHTQGKLPIEKLIEYYPFEDIERAAKDATSGQTIKPVLLFDAA